MIVGAFSFSVGSAVGGNTTDEAQAADATAAKRMMIMLDGAQLCYWKNHGRYTASLAELEENLWQLYPGGFGAGLQGLASAERLHIELDVSRNGRFYAQRIWGEDVDRAMARRGQVFVDYGDLTNEDLRTECRRPW